jgi:diguanylate cyclase (GGDEF)-like protein/putative nucleotidyltransferase with HDIG domain
MTWSELPAKLKTFIICLNSLAMIIASWATWNLFATPHDSGWIVLTLFILLTVPFYLFLPSANAMISIADAYIMAIAMMYGVAPCVMSTFFHTLAISISKRPRIYEYRILFNISSMVCGAWVYSTIYRLLNRGSSSLQDIIVPAAALVTVYFLINSTLTSVAISWSLGESFTKFWMKNCAPLAVDFSFSSLSATVIVMLHGYHRYAPLAAAPVVLVVWGWGKLNKTRVMEAEKHLREQEELYLRTVESLALAVDAKDQTTYGHIRRVMVYATELARLCGIKDQNELKAIRTGSLLHDIGKLAIDDYILNKPGKLSKQEYEKVKMHVAAGDEILQQIRFPFPVAEYVRCHHERWDGLGYPNGLKGEEIPLGGRILAIADAFDAIRYSRPYKLPINIDEAVEILRAQSGTVFDPTLVQLFAGHVNELEKAAFQESQNVPELSFRKILESIGHAVSNSEASLISQHVDVPSELVQFAELCSTVAGCLDRDDLLPMLARRIYKLVPFSTCAFFFDCGNGRTKAEYIAGSFSQILLGYEIEIGKGISGWVAAYGRAMINAEPALDFKDSKNELSTLKHALAVPVSHAENFFGTVSLYREDPNPFTTADLSVLETLIGFVSPLISGNKIHSEQEGGFDPITQVRRISYLTAVAPQVISSAEKNSTPISLIYLEIGNFYQIIRSYGANTGNLLLSRIAECIKPELRETDILVRYGNRAFVGFLPGVRPDQALNCAQRLKAQIKSRCLALSRQNFTVQITTGLSSYPRDGAALFALLQAAQDNLDSGSFKLESAESNVIGFLPRI